MRTELLLGDEAVARGAIDAGISGAFSYPGTPATEIFEYIERHRGTDGARRIAATWSTNEKVAYEEALGMSYMGRRAIVSMKHVGLNVAADPFMSSALTGARGGLVLAVADDPGMHSSQNEQDSRHYAALGNIPVYEPGTQQEAYDMTVEAFTESERLGVPVMMRLVTRLAHSRADVRVRDEPHAATDMGRVADWRDWTLLPVNARRRYADLLEKVRTLSAISDSSPHNPLCIAGPKGILCSGVAMNYVLENLDEQDEYSLLRVGFYPLPVERVRRLIEHCDEVLVVEEGDALIESRLHGLLGANYIRIRGRLSGDLPRAGELNADLVRRALGKPAYESLGAANGLPARPPQLCAGCPHSDSYHHITEALEAYPEARVFSDIGCYTLGAFPPYNAIHSCVEMGASIGMARGASLAGLHPSCCTIGDSTFVHSGIAPLIDAVHDDTNMTVFILDNATTGMTGQQESAGTGASLMRLLEGIGVPAEHLVVVEPLSKNRAENVVRIRREIDHRGLSVVVSRRACVRIPPERRRSTT